MKHSGAPTDDVFGNLLNIRINYSICNYLPITRFLVGEHIFPNLILIFKHSVRKQRQKIKDGERKKNKKQKKTPALQKALISNS